MTAPAKTLLPAQSAPHRLALAPPAPLELEPIAVRWQRALDAAQRAGSQVASEREQTGALLARLARVAGVRRVPWLAPVPVTPALLGLSRGAGACLFEVDGVLAARDGGWKCGARRYLEAAGRAGLERAVLAPRGQTLPGLALLVEERVEAPSALRAEAVAFVHGAGAAAAARASGLAVIGVADGAQAALLRELGAERVVGSLVLLLDRRLRA